MELRDIGLAAASFIGGMACAIPLVFIVLSSIFVLIGRGPWSLLRRRLRRLMWSIGWEWPEYKPAGKRRYSTVYERDLPEPAPDSESSDDGSLGPSDTVVLDA